MPSLSLSLRASLTARNSTHGAAVPVSIRAEPFATKK